MQVLFAENPFDRHSRFRDNHPLERLLKRLRKIVFGKHGKISRTEKRPMPGRVSDVPPDHVIKNVFGKTPEDWYNFTTYPAPLYDVPLSIVTLGNTDWFPPSATSSTNARAPRRTAPARRTTRVSHTPAGLHSPALPESSAAPFLQHRGCSPPLLPVIVTSTSKQQLEMMD